MSGSTVASIHVIERFDRQPVTELAPLPRSGYLATDHRAFLQRLEPPPGCRPPPSPRLQPR